MAQPTEKQALDQARKWLAEERTVTIDEDEAISIDGDPPIAIDLSVEDDKLLISHVAKEEGAGAARADEVVSAIPDRGTMLEVAAAVSKSGVTLTYTNPVYLDGLSRQAVITALNELVSTVDRLGRDAPASTAEVAAAEQPMPEPDTQPQPEPQPEPDAVATEVVEQPVVADIFQTAETTEVTTAAIGWSPTHRVPAGGLRSWDQPDPSLQPSNRLDARVELQVAERRGDWARVVGSNGWTGWVDARRLEAMSTRTGGATRFQVGGLQVSPLPLIGAAGLILASVLPWVDIGGSSANSFEVALSFLWDINAAGSPYLGWAVVAVAVLAVVLAAAKKPNPGLMTLLGVLAVAIAADFVFQMYRGVSDSGGTFGDVFDYLGFAPWVALGSGVVLLVAARR